MSCSCANRNPFFIYFFLIKFKNNTIEIDFRGRLITGTIYANWHPENCTKTGVSNEITYFKVSALVLLQGMNMVVSFQEVVKST